MLGALMRRLIAILGLLLCSAPTWATTYYLGNASTSPVGNDSNAGTAIAPWLTPNHAVNCGDVIIAAASTAYLYSSFNANFGTVTCAAGNNVAWLTCATFDACKISGAGAGGIWIQTSYWGVQAWEITDASATLGTASCFRASPTTPANIHHIIFANVICNGAGANGITLFPYYGGGQYSVDYFVVVGSITYNAAQSSAECYSGISIYEPVATDTKPGSHIYVAGNFSWANLDPNPCGGTAPTDGEGIFFDTFDGSQGSFATAYNQQAVATNNLLFYNGGSGIEVFNNTAGSAGNSAIYFKNNTSYGDKTDPNEVVTYCGDSYIDEAKQVQEYLNIVRTTAATACGSSSSLDAFWVSRSSTTVLVYDNYGYSAAGNNTGSSSYAGSFGPNNTFGTDPAFAAPGNPGAPSCGSASSVPNCMATVIANFTPTTAAAKAYGYQIPSTTSVYDPLYPQWLCTVTNLPTGLVTPGCVVGESVGGSLK